MGLQALLHAVYPPRCLCCDAVVASDSGLCGPCWRDTRFISGLVCDRCGTPLPGDEGAGPALCDDCLAVARPWSQGRAVFVYGDGGRKLVLALKHGDRLDLVRPMGGWLHRAAAPLIQPGTIVAPVPLHRWRLFRRTYNQAALLGADLARRAGLSHCPDLLVRQRDTGSQDGRGREARFANMNGALRVNPARHAVLPGRTVLLVDDVMTSGATLAAAAEACLAAGAQDVRVAVLARVAKDG